MKYQNEIIRIVYKADKWAAFLMLIFQIIIGIFPAFYVISYAAFIDTTLQVLNGEIEIDKAVVNTVVVLFLMLVQYVMSNLLTYFSERCKLSIEISEKERLMKKMSNIDFMEMENSSTYEITNHVYKGIPDKIYNAYSSLLGCINLLMAVSSISLTIAKYSLILSLMIVLCFIPIIWISVNGGKEDYSDLEEYFEVIRRQDCLEEILVGDKTIYERKIYGFSAWLEGRWREKFFEGMNIFLAYKKKSYGRIKKVSQCIKLILWVIVGLVIFIAVKGSITIGICAVLIQQIMNLCSRVTWELYAYLYNISTAEQYMVTYKRCYQLKEERVGNKSKKDVNKIQFVNVSFRYDKEKPYILKNLDLTLEKGKTYALVGENGVGKSTLVKILLGFYTEYEGMIFLDGQELREIQKKDEIFSPVFQNFAQYEIGLRQNVGMLKAEEITDSDIKQILEYLELNLDEKIENDGYDTPLGKLYGKNVELSRGQWQKIAMMRALLQKRQWLILDEPTAALDPIAETNLYNLFFKMMAEKTCLLVTHRLGAAKLADKILVMANGKIEEQGTHEELLQMSNKYSLMYQKQRGWYQDAKL